MKRIFVPTSSGSDWQRLLGKPKLHWKKGYSAMSAAACWEASAPNLPADIQSVLAETKDPALSPLELLMALPEWEVDLPGGDRPSQTDIMAICRNAAGLVILGVEAKVDEPLGPTLGEKRSEGSAGQLERIAYLELMLGCTAPMPDSIRYQLLHRTVSALLTAQAFHASTAIMLIQSFSPTSRWREDFQAFVSALKGKPLSDNMFEIKTGNSPRMLLGWSKGAQEFREIELPSGI